jgi:hypothetical protein
MSTTYRKMDLKRNPTTRQSVILLCCRSDDLPVGCLLGPGGEALWVVFIEARSRSCMLIAEEPAEVPTARVTGL